MNPTMKKIFFHPELDILRAGWKIGIFFGLIAFSNIAVTMPVMSVIKMIPGIPVQTVGTMIAYIMITVATWVMLRFVDRRPFHSFGISFKVQWGNELTQGLLFGSSMMSVIFAIEYSTGMVTIEFRDLSFQQAALTFTNSLALYTVVGYGEEVLFRGYIFQSFVEGTNKIIATLSISLLFAVAHAANPNASMFGLINVGLAGIWLSIAYFKTRALWLPIGLHISWNFFQGFVYSYPVSGTSSENEQIGKAIVVGPDWLTGGAFGPEGGALATLVMVIGTAVIYQWKWVGEAEGVWNYDQWRDDRKQQLITVTPEPVQEQ